MQGLAGRQYDVEPGIHKIAVLRANALGDFILALPALEALRSTYPQAEIVLLGRPWHASFLANRPSPVNRVVAIPDGNIGNESDQQQNPEELRQFFQAIQAERFDLAIQLHGGGQNSNPFVAQLGARLTIGARTPKAPELDRTIPYLYYQPEVFRYLEIVALVGAKPQSLVPQITVMAADLQEAEQIVPVSDRPLVVLHPGATDPRRRWSVEKFAAVGDALAAAEATVVVTGTAPERHLVEAVVHKMNAKAHNLCDRLSLGGLAGLLSRCAVVVTNDSGPLHLAIAVGTPTVGIYWCGNLITAGHLMRTWHRPILSWRLTCLICGANCMEAGCDHDASFVDDISIEEVQTAALALLV